MKKSLTIKQKQRRISCTETSLASLTAAALVLPGLLLPNAQAAEEDSVDFQYSHYQEGKRDINLIAESFNTVTFEPVKVNVPNNRNPIEVDSLHGTARVSLTDRVKFAFNYIEDTWSGATPFGSAPEGTSANHFEKVTFDDDGSPIVAGASPWATTDAFLDRQGNFVTSMTDPATGKTSYVKARPMHVMSYASPETRKQGDFKLSYAWDEAVLDVGGGISLERDYESRFVNLGGRMDFNRKQTSVNLGLSYTNSEINAVLDGPGPRWINSLAYKDQMTDIDADGQGSGTLHGIRQDWATHLVLTQIITADALLELGIGYTRSTGFLENPYKASWIYGVIDPNAPSPPDGADEVLVPGAPYIEQRPDERNQWNWTARWAHYVAPLDAALHLDYQFATDDWGINAHTFAANWVQPIGAGWTVTPRIRYYSQEAADFYEPYFKRNLDANGQTVLPGSFSSDQRLSGFGTLSGGLTVSKDFAKGVRLETGIEYYTHQGSYKLGGGGEDSFADFDYWVANAALKVNLSSLGKSPSGDNQEHLEHSSHAIIPAGLLFGHTLSKSGDMMVGYRFMHSWQAGVFLHGDKVVSEQRIIDKACPGYINKTTVDDINQFGCGLLPREMAMNMHMLDIMYAPTDWLTLMLMPQFMDMQMPLFQPESLIDDSGHGHGGGHGGHNHETGGIGDTGIYAMVNLFDAPHHHLHVTAGLSAPTGDVVIKRKIDGDNLNRDGAYHHYGMQLGSGTWDFKPSLTYTGKAEAWSWGAQVGGTKRLEDSNNSGYALGDLFETSLWGGYGLTNWLSTTVRAVYSWQGRIKGHFHTGRRDQEILRSGCPKFTFVRADDNDFDGIPDGPTYLHEAEYNACLNDYKDVLSMADAQDRPSPMDATGNYGGHYVDIGFGLNATVPTGPLEGNRLAVEWLQPLYTNVNGYQLDRDGSLSFTWSYGF
ncbi:MAG: DUF3570 domain-containing protein [Methylococcaceae bacterium]|nr:DUF3570 domain-containing protein [Methylococcaceae bacterium]